MVDVSFVRGEAIQLDTAAKAVTLVAGDRLVYDSLVVATGRASTCRLSTSQHSEPNIKSVWHARFAQSLLETLALLPVTWICQFQRHG